MDFRLLGPVTAQVDGEPVDLGEPQQRLFLAILLLAESRLVPAETLVARIWGETPPANPHRLLTNIANKARRLLNAGEHGAGNLLPPSEGGYLLLVDRERVDLWRFHDLCSQARVRTDSEPGAALRDMRLGLAEWKEAPGDRVRPEPLFRLEGEWIANMRITLQTNYRDALIDCAHLELRFGQNGQTLAELGALARIDPLDQTVAELRMRAFCLANQYEAAKIVFRDLSKHLREEEGNDPDSALQQLFQRVSNNDPALRRVATDPPPATIEEPVTDPGTTPPDKAATTLARSAAQLVVETARDGAAEHAGMPGGDLIHLLRKEFDGDNHATATLTRLLSSPGDLDAVRQLRQILVVCLRDDQSFRQDVERLVDDGPALAKGGIYAEKIRNAAVYNEKVVINRGGFRIGG